MHTLHTFWETPSASCVVNVTSTRLYTFSHSGWWSIFSANNAVRLINDHAWLKSAKVNIFIIALFSFVWHRTGTKWRKEGRRPNQTKQWRDIMSYFSPSAAVTSVHNQLIISLLTATHGNGVPWYVSNRTDAATSSFVNFCGASCVDKVEEKDRHDVVVLLVAALCKDETDRVKDLRVFIVILCYSNPKQNKYD